MITEGKLTVNNVYMLLKKHDIAFENVNKEIVYKILVNSSENCNSNSQDSTRENNNEINNFIDIPSPNSILNQNHKIVKVSEEEQKSRDLSFDATISESSFSTNENNYNYFAKNFHTKDFCTNIINNTIDLNNLKIQDIDRKFVVQNFEEMNKNEFFSILNDENKNDSHDCFSYLNL